MAITLKKSTDAANVTEHAETFYDQNMAAIQAALNAIPVIEAGAVQLPSINAGSTGTAAVTFTKTFANNPSIALTSNAAVGHLVDLSVVNNTKTGFTVSAKAGITGQYWVHWIAVERPQ